MKVMLLIWAFIGPGDFSIAPAMPVFNTIEDCLDARVYFLDNERQIKWTDEYKYMEAQCVILNTREPLT